MGAVSSKLLFYAEVSVEKDICTHPGVIGGMCIRCGQKMDDQSGVAFGYIHKVSLLKSILQSHYLKAMIGFFPVGLLCCRNIYFLTFYMKHEQSSWPEPFRLLKFSCFCFFQSTKVI